MESWHGTEYANRLVYKSLPFLGLQLAMFLSILAATLIRLPPKKHLYGFYVIHSGLIILFIGSFITFYSGIDGSLTLEPNLPSREIVINEDELSIKILDSNKELELDLPYVSGPHDLNFRYQEIKLKTYLPFALEQTKWLQTNIPGKWSSQYRFFKQDFSQNLTFSLHPSSNFEQDFTLGPLRFYYLHPLLAECFARNTTHSLVVWNIETGQCQTNLAKSSKVFNRRRMVSVDTPLRKLAFFPEMSPLPLNNKKQFEAAVPYRIFNKKLFEKSPILFLFGESVVYFDKSHQRWEQKTIDSKSVVQLPWMGFKLELLEHREDAFPFNSPNYAKPEKTNGQTMVEGFKAIEVEIGEDKFWVKSSEPYAFEKNGKRIIFELGKKSVILPYEITLDKFKIETDPGTKNPASFESFVTLFKGAQGSSKHHVFMNHPLKVDEFTFYQASYFTSRADIYGSVLSVNFDPGRPWKYLGSLMLILGSIWHYYFLRRKKNIPLKAKL